ncbi:MAG TPA: lanthionine synthetase LanC family protein, partial [Bacteroidales bacterium]|nr:lanthionine synthetase LanC family protein [Bacteroidales bacterium]
LQSMSSDLKQRLDSRLQRIANVLLLNASFIDNLGLLNGKMGIAIFFYHYAKYTGNEVYSEYAGELIDEIYSEINTSTPIDFENGLTGIGWGIEYLVQNGFVEADTDEVLEQIDEAVYQKILLHLEYKDLKGLLLYQNIRNKAAL